MRYRFIRFPEGKCKAVTFSYDDASAHDRRLLETINKYGIKCTFNVNSQMISDDPANRLSRQEIRELKDKYGHEVAVHGARHIAPGRTTAVNGIRDILECRLELEKLMNCIIRGMAYPDSGIRKMSAGVDYEAIKQYVEDLGIAYSRTLEGDNNLFELPNDWYAWMPTCHHKNPNFNAYADEFLNLDIKAQYISGHDARLFYLWGHSHEFARDDNWDLLDAICQKLGGHEDIWYATNIEICDYVKAYRSLIFSVDNDIVYNPTQLKIWFEADNKDYCIEPGETLYLTEE